MRVYPANLLKLAAESNDKKHCWDQAMEMKKKKKKKSKTNNKKIY